MDLISKMDPLSVKHIEKGKNQVIVVFVLGLMTVVSSLVALGLGSVSYTHLTLPTNTVV